MTLVHVNQPMDERGGPVSEKLDAYLENRFSSAITPVASLTVDEPYVTSWATYDTTNARTLLTTCYPQLGFPIEAGINKTQPYVDAVLRGKSRETTHPNPLVLTDPASLTVERYESFAGTIPVVHVPDGQDFEKVVQCLLHKNNPVAVPQSMGALLANGLVNWDRLHRLKREWIRTNSAEGWNHEFSTNVLPRPGLYKDKLIVLSGKPYSNVAAHTLDLTEADWLRYSLTIRLAHECTHLYTLKRYGCATNNLHDELIADYIGISKALGKYNAEWMLAFMGLEAYPTYRKGARLENYVSNAALSPEEFTQLTTLIKSAINTIARFDAELGPIRSTTDQFCRIDALCATDLTTMASADGWRLLRKTYKDLYAS